MCTCVCLYLYSLPLAQTIEWGRDLLSFETESRWAGAEDRDVCVRLGLTTSERKFLFMFNILVLDHSNII